MFFELLLSAHFLPPFTISLLRCCPLSFSSVEWIWPLLLRPPHSTNRKLSLKVCDNGGNCRPESRLKWNITHQARQHLLLIFHVPGISTRHCELSTILFPLHSRARKQTFSLTLLLREFPGPLGALPHLPCALPSTTTEGSLCEFLLWALPQTTQRIIRALKQQFFWHKPQVTCVV